MAKEKPHTFIRIVVKVSTGQRRPRSYEMALYKEEGNQWYWCPKSSYGIASYYVAEVMGDEGRQFETTPTVGKKIMFVTLAGLAEASLPSSVTISATRIDDPRKNHFRFRVRCDAEAHRHSGVVVGKVISFKRLDHVLAKDQKRD